jgi:hypothetical protein
LLQKPLLNLPTAKSIGQKELKESGWMPKSPRSSYVQREPTTRAKVSEYIEMPTSSFGSEEKKFAFYRDV